MSNLWRKLNLKEQREILVCNAPASFEAAIGKLEHVRVHRTHSDRTAITFLLAFVTKREEIAIGIGEDRRSRSFPSHTTRHAGPHLAVR